MRRFAVVLFCCFVFQGVCPTPAQAFWEFIEEWSGPGRFSGWTLDGRLFCFFTDGGQKPDTTDDTEGARFGGLVYSACGLKANQKRRASIDLGMGFLWADKNPEYADRQRISLTILEPSFSWPVLAKSNNWDFFDYGVGAGIYWVSSVVFPAVRGTFLEPVRLDFHAPTKAPWRYRIPVFRVGLLVFPAGHERAAFAPRDPSPARISRDWVVTYGLFWDLDPLINRNKK